MKAKTLLLAATIAASTMLGSCDSIKHIIGGKPKGQVVATVNGDEITVLDLRDEMQGFSSREPKAMKAAQEQALQRIIMRTLVIQKAKEQKLDKSVQYATQLRRGEQGLLGQLYQQKIATATPAPSRQDAESYVASHPESFANRRLLVVDQVLAPPSNKVTPDQFKALNTLDAVKAVYDNAGVPYQENVGVIDTLSADPQLIAQIDKLPPGEIFVIPQRGVLAFNHLDTTRIVPFRGDIAVTYATNLLRQQRAQQTVGKQMEALRRSAEPKIVYNESYRPTKPLFPPAPQAATPASKAP